MRARPRAAFVVTVSIAGSIAASVLGSACHKESKDGKEPNSSCEPPECHMNPPPPPPETDRPPTANPPPLPRDGGTTAATATATAASAVATSRSGRNPPALLPDGGRLAK